MSLLDGWTPPGSITPFGGVPCTCVQPAQPAQICVCNVGHHPQRLLHVLHLAGEHGHGEQREAGPDVPSTGLVGIRRVRTGLVRVAMMTMRRRSQQQLSALPLASSVALGLLVWNARSDPERRTRPNDAARARSMVLEPLDDYAGSSHHAWPETPSRQPHTVSALSRAPYPPVASPRCAD